MLRRIINSQQFDSRLILLSLLIAVFVAGCATSPKVPTETPTATAAPTATATSTATATATVAPTATEIIESYIEMEYPSGCSEEQIPAGRVVFGFGAGCGDDPECLGIGDTSAVMTIDGEPIPPLTDYFTIDNLSIPPLTDETPLRDDGRTVEVQWHGIQYGHNTYAVIDLEPGVYQIHGTWNRLDFIEERACTLTVTGP
jgi:hypothetical protein